MLLDLSGINIEAFRIADSLASPLLNYIMLYLLLSYLIVLPAIAIYLYYKRDKNLFSYVIAILLLYAVAEAIKMIVREPRPCSLPSFSFINQLGCGGGYSFPSEHASVLTGLFLFLDKYKYLRALYLVWLVIVLFGKIFLGQHYLTDIIAGAVLSLVVSGIMYLYRSRINGFLNSLAGRFFKPLYMQ